MLHKTLSTDALKSYKNCNILIFKRLENDQKYLIEVHLSLKFFVVWSNKNDQLMFLPG